MAQQTVGQVIRDQRRTRRVQFWAGFLVLLMCGLAWAGLSRAPLSGFDRAIFDGPFGVPEPAIAIEDFPADAFPVPPPMLDPPFPLPTPVPFDG